MIFRKCKPPNVCPRCGKPRRESRYRKHDGLWLPNTPLRSPLVSAGMPSPLGLWQPVGDDCCACGPACANCIGGTLPDSFTIALSGLLCGGLNSTFTLDFMTPAESTEAYLGLTVVGETMNHGSFCGTYYKYRYEFPTPVSGITDFYGALGYREGGSGTPPGNYVCFRLFAYTPATSDRYDFVLDWELTHGGPYDNPTNVNCRPQNAPIDHKYSGWWSSSCYSALAQGLLSA